VLGILLLQPDRVVTVDRRCDLLWDGQPPAGGEPALARAREWVRLWRAVPPAAGLGQRWQNHHDPHGAHDTADPGRYGADGVHML
jgi:hypothetical protein